MQIRHAPRGTPYLRPLWLGVLALFIGGCASIGKVENLPMGRAQETPDYSLSAFNQQWRESPNALMLAFSGGGTRAAALSYGVLKEMRDIHVPGALEEGQLIDQIHTISSVSGGSFTAAYYGLFGDRIFEDYEEVFLRQNVQSALLRRLLNPFNWFTSAGRTEFAIDYYETEVFEGATFADMLTADHPIILINASDFAKGVRFSFIQDYFNLFCSDLSSFPVARAVAASSAVPVLFNPVVVENYPDCSSKADTWLATLREQVQDRPDILLTVDGLASYDDEEERHYIHFVDGGITDNLGIRALYDIVELHGGIKNFNEKMRRKPMQRLVLITVDASTDPQTSMDRSLKRPSISESISAMSSVQLHRYNADTLALLKEAMDHWAEQLSTPTQQVEPYFITLSLADVEDPERHAFLNRIPTSFYLSDEQVDALIATGGELLRENAEFRRLMADLEANAR